MKEEALKLADELEKAPYYTSDEGDAADMIRKQIGRAHV